MAITEDDRNKRMTDKIEMIRLRKLLKNARKIHDTDISQYALNEIEKIQKKGGV